MRRRPHLVLGVYVPTSMYLHTSAAGCSTTKPKPLCEPVYTTPINNADNDNGNSYALKLFGELSDLLTDELAAY